MSIRLKQVGPGSSLQDHGRRSWQRYGVSVSGPMDSMAARFANAIVENRTDEVVIEIDQFGLSAVAESDCTIGIVAPMGSAMINADALPPLVRVKLHAGDTLTIAPQRGGGWAYLSIVGGFQGASQLGSVSYHHRSQLGGPQLKPEALLFSNEQGTANLSAAAFPALEAFYQPQMPLRLIMGPQDDMIAPDAIKRLMEGDFTLSLRCDRMGYRLEGQPLAHTGGADIVSDGIAMGTIQVPGDGQPIILMADRQTAGGYPKLGVVITADLPRLAQHLIGPKSPALKFQAVSHEQAVQALKAANGTFEKALKSPVPLGPRTLTTDLLMQHNLIDGVVS